MHGRQSGAELGERKLAVVIRVKHARERVAQPVLDAVALEHRRSGRVLVHLRGEDPRDLLQLVRQQRLLTEHLHTEQQVLHRFHLAVVRLQRAPRVHGRHARGKRVRRLRAAARRGRRRRRGRGRGARGAVHQRVRRLREPLHGSRPVDAQ